MNNSACLKSYSISKRNSTDNRKSLLGLFFYWNPQHPIFFFWNVLYHCTMKPGPGQAQPGFFPSAELHSLPHVTLSVACYSWPTYLIYFSGDFFWNNNNKKMFWDVFHKKWKGSAVSVGEWQGRSLLPAHHNSAARGLCLTAFAFTLVLRLENEAE